MSTLTDDIWCGQSMDHRGILLRIRIYWLAVSLEEEAPFHPHLESQIDEVSRMQREWFRQQQISCQYTTMLANNPIEKAYHKMSSAPNNKRTTNRDSVFTEKCRGLLLIIFSTLGMHLNESSRLVFFRILVYLRVLMDTCHGHTNHRSWTKFVWTSINSESGVLVHSSDRQPSHLKSQCLWECRVQQWILNQLADIEGYGVRLAFLCDDILRYLIENGLSLLCKASDISNKPYRRRNCISLFH